MSRLTEIQQALKAPKNQFNKFGGYSYRNCEDILEALKPLLQDDDIFHISDELVYLGERYYVKATATFNDVSVTAYAREAAEQKGMSASQLTGATSSFARKYALNGLFCIDDTKDADTMDNSKEKVTPYNGGGAKAAGFKTQKEFKEWYSKQNEIITNITSMEEFNQKRQSVIDAVAKAKLFDEQCADSLGQLMAKKKEGLQ